MTIPAAGGRSITLVPGDRPVMITEYARGSDDPVLIINLDVSAGRIYLGADSTLSAANGVPVDPGTAAPWSQPGQLWAIADPAATSNITAVITSAIDDWTPSPAAIAAQVAAQLLAQGVPNVLTETIIDDGTAIAAGGFRVYDVTGYASLSLLIAGLGGYGGLGVTFTFFDPFNNEMLTGAVPFQVPARLAVVGPSLQLINEAGVRINPFVIGSNRPAAGATPLDLRNVNQLTDQWSITTPVAGVQDMTRFVAGPHVQGLVYAQCTIPNNIVKGRFELKMLGGSNYGNPSNIVVLDTGQMPLDSAGSQSGGLLMAVPAGVYLGQFNCSTPGGGTSRMRLTQA